MEINLLRNTTCSIADIEQSNILCLGGGFSKVQVGFLLMWPFAVNWELEAFSAHFSLLLLLRPSCQHSYRRSQWKTACWRCSDNGWGFHRSSKSRL